MTDKTKVARAWIIIKLRVNQKEEVISVLKWQKSLNQVEEHIVQLYLATQLHPSDMISYLKWRNNNWLNYKPKVDKNKITIWHTPYLLAKQVKNLKVNTINWAESWSWEEF
jgi:hypothetical protein